MDARKTTVQNQRVTVSFQRAPATTDVVVHKARKLGASRGARGALWAHASSVHNRVNALRSSARDGRTKNHCAESTSYREFPERDCSSMSPSHFNQRVFRDNFRVAGHPDAIQEVYDFNE